MKRINEEDHKELEVEEEAKPHVGWKPRVITGFKDGDGETPITNWLLLLKKGTIFLAMNKIHPDILLEYKITHQFDEAVRLQFDDHRGIGEIWVEPELFVKKNDFIMTIIEGENE